MYSLTQLFQAVKTRRLLVVSMIVFFITTTNSCRKDNLTGPFAIEAHDFLASDKYDKLEVEIVYVNGYQPQQSSIDHLKSFLDARLNKSRGITIVYKNISSPGKSYYTIDDLEKVEKKERINYTKHHTISAYIFFADAGYSDPNVLGIAYGTTSMAIFERVVNDNSGGLSQPSRYVLEATSIEHEFGHILGLVDNGTKMVNGHLDNAHPHHCNNQNCLMYYGVETTDVLGNLMGGEIPELDENCINDLRANGGK
jgi:hypothetical protein